ncbi:eisosome component PIL1 [Rhizoctonia solani 123E]|uniref:Eisosome component PIL1 n=1 Tax=Rhizoctonia solani 123E TaxID=1423351 RepID=A0A074S1P4_9AGAM|nr:eisosome component PIL1 [Rhizoctonia solani 123E]
MFKSRPSGGMLGSVGAKIAHASTITALGNPELRTLQDLITAEKGVLLGIQRLAGDIGKSAEMLKIWGQGEGDDLGDVLTHSTNLLAQFSAALTQFASYEEQIRTQMKSIRSREEDLDEMKRRKRAVDHKADSADKKLARMSAEHKGRMAQVELLNELKEEGRRLEIDIVNEEAAIGDFKRRATREFLGLKFAGMVELAEKTTIIGDLGKLMIEEIPLHTTPPGQPRALYSGREKTAELSSEAMRCTSEVRINVPVLPEPTPAMTTFQPFNQFNDSGSPAPVVDPTNGAAPRGQTLNEFGESQFSGPGESGFSTGSLRIGEDGARFGNTGAGEFHTLPVGRGNGYSGGLPPISLSDHGRTDTFSSSIADALSHDPTFSPQRVPSPHPHQPPPFQSPPHLPTAPVGTYAPPPGPPPGALHVRQPSDTYFSHVLPDPTQSSSPLMPPYHISEGSPWASTPSPPANSRPLPFQPEEGKSDLAYARDPSPAPPSHSPVPPVPAAPPAPPAPGGHDASTSLHTDAPRDLAPSPQSVRDPSPVRSLGQEKHEISNAAIRDESREMDVPATAPYASPPRHQLLASSPLPQPQSPPHKANTGLPYSLPSEPLPRTPSPPPVQSQESTYGTPSEYPNPFASSLPRLPTLPPLGSVPSVTSPISPGGTGRTISAGAFRRNVPRSDTLDPGMSAPPPISPLSVKKKLLPGGDDIPRGDSPAPTSPGAPPIYSVIDDEGMSLGRSTSPSVGRSGGESKPPQI